MPIFKVDDDLAPSFEGSGVLARVDGAELLVSAAHVFDELHSGVHLLLDQWETKPLAQPIRVSVMDRPGPRVFDKIDLGLVHLTADEVSALGRENFVDVVPRQAASEMRWHLRYLVLGYPYRKQERVDAEQLYRVNQTYYTAPELRDAEYQKAGVELTQHIAIHFNHRRIAGAKGKGGRPNFRGMSGGGIWQFDPYSTTPGLPELVGFLAGPAPRNKKALFGASTTTLIRMVRTA